MMSFKAPPVLDQIDELVNLEGDFCDFGYKKTDADLMIAHTKEFFPDKPYCTLTNWCWADVHGLSK